MNDPRESLYDTAILALGPLMLGYAVTLVVLLVSYARP